MLKMYHKSMSNKHKKYSAYSYNDNIMTWMTMKCYKKYSYTGWLLKTLQSLCSLPSISYLILCSCVVALLMINHYLVLYPFIGGGRIDLIKIARTLSIWFYCGHPSNSHQPSSALLLLAFSTFFWSSSLSSSLNIKF